MEKSQKAKTYSNLNKLAKAIYLFFFVALTLGVSFSLFAKTHFFFELFSHYVVYYALLSLLLIFTALIRKQFLIIIALIPILAIQLSLISPYLASPFIENTNIHTTNNSISILASNVHLTTKNFDDLNLVINEEDPDIFVIHEANSLWNEEVKKYTETHPYQSLNAPGVKGMVIASKNPGTFANLTLADVPIMEFTAQNEASEPIYRIIAIHPPAPILKSYAEERNAHLEELSKYIKGELEYGLEKSDLPTIVIGDFNISPWSPYFQDFLSNTKLKDSRLRFGINNTWHAHNLLFSIPIDHALVSPNIQVLDFHTTDSIQSDHLPIFVELSI